jgi:hypothetical protein
MTEDEAQAQAKRTEKNLIRSKVGAVTEAKSLKPTNGCTVYWQGKRI